MELRAGRRLEQSAQEVSVPVSRVLTGTPRGDDGEKKKGDRRTCHIKKSLNRLTSLVRTKISTGMASATSCDGKSRERRTRFALVERWRSMREGVIALRWVSAGRSRGSLDEDVRRGYDALFDVVNRVFDGCCDFVPRCIRTTHIQDGPSKRNTVKHRSIAMPGERGLTHVWYPAVSLSIDSTASRTSGGNISRRPRKFTLISFVCM